MHWMKKVSAMLLFFLLISMCPSFSFDPFSSGKEALIFTLDVCSTSHNSLAANADFPAIEEYPGKPAILPFAGIVCFVNDKLKPSVFIFKKDRPPEV
jgi:hypothetical protein